MFFQEIRAWDLRLWDLVKRQVRSHISQDPK